MFVSTRRFLTLVVASAVLMVPSGAHAQTSLFDACSQGALSNCARIRLTSQLGAGAGGSNLFQIAIDNLGSQASPGLPTSIYFLALITGEDPATEIDPFATPTAAGGATISDPSAWSIAETGDVIILSAPGNDGIGGCASAAPVNGFGQMAQTCGTDQFVSFSFATPRNFDPGAMTLADLEFVAVADGNGADSCNDQTPCTVTPVTSTPEPGTMLLALTGFAGIAGFRRRTRCAGSAGHLNSEA
jgi:hypothetical protein